jgi:hypothetical protein
VSGELRVGIEAAATATVVDLVAAAGIRTAV